MHTRKQLGLLGLMFLLLGMLAEQAGAQSLIDQQVPDLVFLTSAYNSNSATDGSSVTSLVSGAGYATGTVFTPPAGVPAPTRTNAGLGGRPQLTFTGSQYLTWSDPLVLQSQYNSTQTQGGYSILLVYTPLATSDQGTLLSKNTANEGKFDLIARAKYTTIARGQGVSSGSTGAGPSYIVIYTFSPTVSETNGVETLYCNGVLLSTRTGVIATSDLISGLTLGGSTDGQFLYNGSISEVALWSHCLDTYEVAALTNNRASTYGLTVTALSATALSAPPIARAVYSQTNANSSVLEQSPVWGPNSQSLTFRNYNAAGNYFGGTAPYTYQWYRSTTNSFAPGAGNLLSGATSATLADTGLTLATTYYYVCKITDSAATPASVFTAQFAAPTCGLLEGNIGIVGDSISVLDPGAGLAGDNGAPSDQFALYTGRSSGKRLYVLNRGVAGSTTNDWQPTNTTGTYANALTSAATAFNAANVKYVLLMLGANDCRNGYEDGPVSAATFLTRLTAIVNYLTGAGFVVILNAPGWTNLDTTVLLPSYSTAMDTLANGTTVYKGDRSAYSYFLTHQAEMPGFLHPGNYGVMSWGNLWSNAFIKATGPQTGTKRRLQ